MSENMVEPLVKKPPRKAYSRDRLDELEIRARLLALEILEREVEKRD
jgi:hypothetical protein